MNSPDTPELLIEAVARAIYNQWETVEGFVPWVDGGNSHKQDAARTLAREALAASPSTEGAPVPAQQAVALENCRLFAARHRKEEWGATILRFCAEAGVTGSPLRASPSTEGAPVPAQQAAEGFALRNMATTLGLWLPWVTEPGPKTSADIDAFAAILRQAQDLLASQPPSPQPPLPVVAVVAPEQPQSIYPTSDCVACASKTALPEGLPQGEWLDQAMEAARQFAHAYFNYYSDRKQTADDLSKFQDRLRAHLSLRIAPQVDAQQAMEVLRELIEALDAFDGEGITGAKVRRINAAKDRARSLASAATKKGD